jgi:hypothetical protein
MIGLQSPAIAESSSRRPCHSPPHACAPGVEGRLIQRGRQSAPTCLSDSGPARDRLCRPLCPNVFFRSVTLRPSSLFWTPGPANPNCKSTPAYRKSTVDLRLEPLIWGKNGLQTVPLPGWRHLLCPITAWESRRPDQNQTESGNFFGLHS